MPEIRIEPASDGAPFARTLEVWNAVFPRRRMTLDEVRSDIDAFRDFQAWLALADGEVAGAAHAYTAAFTDVPGAAIYVFPEHRRRGAGSALFRALSAWLAELGATEARAGVDEDDPESLAWARQRGFVEVSRECLLELDLRELEAPSVDPPPGIEISTWAERPDVIRGIYDVVCEAWPDIPGTEDEHVEPYDEWFANHMQGAGDRREGTFVALADEEVVGYAKLTFGKLRPETAFHDLTGVKRAWRGRGIARALKRAQIAWAKANGYERLETTNELRNEPIRRINEELGYRPAPGRIRLKGFLSGS
jgi:GNAT superfamily N-acetyltransferase